MILNENLADANGSWRTYSSHVLFRAFLRMSIENFDKLWANLNGKSYSGLAGEPRLWDYYDYPELFLVDYNFCVQE